MDKFQVLKQYFGHTEFRKGQAELIDNILSGKDALGIMPTGAGKSMCYQIPALILDGVTIVISPLISLMKDQVNALVQSGVPAAYINSSLSYSQYNEVFRRANTGAYKIIYVAPERLVTDEFITFAENTRISMVTVDEAHCVSQWGQDFRPSYMKIPEFTERLSYRPIISAFTATATADVKEDISRLLKLEKPFAITTGFDRENLYFEVRRPAKKLDELLKIMKENQNNCAIVYCSTRKNVELVCDALNDAGFSATRYHAGLSDKERHENQDDFLYDRRTVMVATNAFGMGIDKSNVSLVVHYNMPKNLESYYQEAGRAGRDGEPANCILLYSGQDVRTNEFMIKNSAEENEELSDAVRSELLKRDLRRLKEMTFYSTTSDCLRGFILKYFGENGTSYCGHCSSCCTDYETSDITIAAQKILSCVIRIKNMQRTAGKVMITDILRGTQNDKIISAGYDKLTTYGLMSDTDPRTIRVIMDFLIRGGYLAVSEGEYPVILPGEKATEIIRDKIKLEMKLPREKKTAIAKKVKKADLPISDDLLSQLKALRRKFADAEGVPAYIIFTDATLRDMCKKMPADTDELLDVSGVGSKKSERYGSEFIKLINGFSSQDKAENGWSKNNDGILTEDYDSGLSINQMSKKHGKFPDEIRKRLRLLGLTK